MLLLVEFNFFYYKCTRKIRNKPDKRFQYLSDHRSLAGYRNKPILTEQYRDLKNPTNKIKASSLVSTTYELAKPLIIEI